MRIRGSLIIGAKKKKKKKAVEYWTKMMKLQGKGALKKLLEVNDKPFTVFRFMPIFKLDVYMGIFITHVCPWIFNFKTQVVDPASSSQLSTRSPSCQLFKNTYI